MPKPVYLTDENLRPPLRDSTNTSSPLNSSDSAFSNLGRFYTAEVYHSSPRQPGSGESRDSSSIRRIISDPFPVPETDISTLPVDLHHPHQLDTITETRSNLTRHTSRFSERSDSQNQTHIPSKPQPRSRSFSVNDILGFLNPVNTYKTNRNPRNCVLSSSSSSSCCFSAPTYPHFPPLPRLTAPPTPPNLPTFNTRAAASYRLPSPPPPSPPHLSVPPRASSLPFHQRIIRALYNPLAMRPNQEDTERREEENEWHRATSNLPRGAIMRAPNGTLVRGTWRPSQSGHTGVPPRRNRGSRRNRLVPEAQGEREREREAERRGSTWVQSGGIAAPEGEERTEAEIRAQVGREMERVVTHQGENRAADADGDGDVEAQLHNNPSEGPERNGRNTRNRDKQRKKREKLARFCEKLCPCCYEDVWDSASDIEPGGNGDENVPPPRPRAGSGVTRSPD